MSTGSARRILVPVGDSVTVRNTVAYAVREGANAECESVVHFVFPVSWRSGDLTEEAADEATELLDRIPAWVREDLDVDEDEDLPVSITTAVIGEDEYLFSPRDYADVLLEYAREHDLGHVVLDPEYRPGSRARLLSPLATELGLAEAVTYEEAPVERAVRGRRLLRRTGDVGTFLTIFGLSFLFYQVIGGFAGTFDYVTGALSATIVAAVLSGITFDRRIQPAVALWRSLRWAIYIPYLLWEVTKANFQVAYIVLHPSLPIDPSMERIRPAVPLGLPVTTLANSITLTPGTVTVDVREREFYVHALTQSSRDSLYAGGLERAVRFVFFGRSAARIPTPEERGQREEAGHDVESDSGNESSTDGDSNSDGGKP